MGAVRLVDWMKPSTLVTARRPSWLAPPQPPPPRASERPRLSVVPGPKVNTIPPPSAGGPISARPVSTRPSVEAILTRERAEHEQTVRELNDELETLRQTTAQLAQRLATTRRHVLEASEGELVKLALVIAERVVGTQIALDPVQIVSWAKEAIATLPARDALVVALSTDLAEQLPESVWTDLTNGRHTLEVDPSLPKGTCDVRATVASVEVSAAARMAAVGETIGALT